MDTERIIVTTLIKILVMPFNIGLIMLTGLIWILSAYFPYYNANFDLISTLANYITFFSGGCIIALLLLKDRNDYIGMQSMAIITFILSILTLLAIKSAYLSNIGYIIFLPLNIFCFLLTLKNIWLEMQNIEFNEVIKKN
jgi:hypothetical protein